MSVKTSHLTDELKRRKNNNSKDFLKLKAQDDILVFVYGTLRIGGHNFELLENEKYLGEAATVSDGYCMFDSKWNFPVVSPWKRGDRGIPGFIYGELFAVSPLTILELDRLEGNGVMYQREEKWFWAYDQKVNTSNTTHPALRAWVYLSVPGYWSKDELSICPRVKSKQTQKHYFDWMQSTKKPDPYPLSDLFDEEEPEYGTPEYYDKYYRFEGGRYVEGVKTN